MAPALLLATDFDVVTLRGKGGAPTTSIKFSVL